MVMSSWLVSIVIVDSFVFIVYFLGFCFDRFISELLL